MTGKLERAVEGLAGVLLIVLVLMMASMVGCKNAPLEAEPAWQGAEFAFVVDGDEGKIMFGETREAAIQHGAASGILTGDRHTTVRIDPGETPAQAIERYEAYKAGDLSSKSLLEDTCYVVEVTCGCGTGGCGYAWECDSGNSGCAPIGINHPACKTCVPSSP